MQLCNQHPCLCASSWQHSFPCRLASNHPRPFSCTCLFNSSLQKSAHVRLRFSIMSKTGPACSDFCGHKQRDSMSKHESMLYQSCSCAASYILDEECLLSGRPVCNPTQASSQAFQGQGPVKILQRQVNLPAPGPSQIQVCIYYPAFAVSHMLLPGAYLALRCAISYQGCEVNSCCGESI